MTMNLDPHWFDVLLVLWNMSLSAAVWLRKPGQDAVRAVNALREEVHTALGEVRGSVSVLQERVEHMPTDKELAQLEGAVRTINASIEGINRSQTAISAALHRIEDYLLQNK